MNEKLYVNIVSKVISNYAESNKTSKALRAAINSLVTTSGDYETVDKQIAAVKNLAMGGFPYNELGFSESYNVPATEIAATIEKIKEDGVIEIIKSCNNEYLYPTLKAVKGLIHADIYVQSFSSRADILQAVS